MSAVLTDFAPEHSENLPNGAAEPALSRRSGDPIGARFPRPVPLDASSATSRSDATGGSAPIFPVGAKFSRRTAADILVYLAELERAGGPVSSTSRIYPIGVRFPLR